MKKFEKIIIEVLDTIAVLGFAISSILSAYHYNIPSWVTLMFAVLGLGFSLIGMLNKKVSEDEAIEM